MYAKEAMFHTLINKIPRIQDTQLAEIVAVEVYMMAYGLSASHPWSACLKSDVEHDFYHEQLGKFLALYKNTNISSLGISFETFMSFTPESIAATVLSTSEKTDKPG